MTTDARPAMVVVVAYGAEAPLAASLAALGPVRPIVVVDNRQSDEARRVSVAAGATYRRPESNIGFAAAVNLALRDRPPATDVLLLNPDARLAPEDLAVMQSELRNQADLAAVAPRLSNPDGSPQKVEWPLPSPWIALAGVVGVADRLSRRRFVSGAVLLLRGEALDALGGFDERFFLYSEEADWQLTAIRAGWRVGLADGARAVHQGAGSSSDARQRELLFNASAERFVRKWYGASGWQVFRVASILAAARRILASRDSTTRATQYRAIRHYWRGPVRAAGPLLHHR